MIAMSFDDLDDKAELLYMTIQGRSSTSPPHNKQATNTF